MIETAKTREAPSIRSQCKLLEVNRSTVYEKRPSKKIDLYEEEMKQEILDTYQKFPSYGVRRMRKMLNRKGYKVGRKRVKRMFDELGLEAIYPKPNTSMARKEHKKYPYLLKGLKIAYPDQVWGSDITYIKLPGGHVYLVIIMDIHSRYVISWYLSNTMDSSLCVQALKDSLKYGTPEIFNTDQGSQYTSTEFTDILHQSDIKISMDGKGRCFDNIFVERFWRTIKYEMIYLYEFRTIKELKHAIGEYIELYNTERLHQELDYQPPAEVYLSLNNANQTVA